VRSQRAETEALVELQQRLKDIGQDTHLLDIPDAPEVAEKMETAIRSVRTAAAREFTGEFADVGEQIADAMKNLEGGNLGRGVLEVSSAVEDLNKRHADLSERQLAIYTRLVDMASDLKEAAIEISGTMDEGSGRAPRTSRAGGSGPGGSPSSLAAIYERINPRLSGPNAEQGAVQSLTSMLPGSGGQGFGGPLTGAAVTGVGQQAFGAMGSYAVPVAAVAGAGMMGYQVWQNYAMQTRGYERIAGEMDPGQAIQYDIQARTMALSPFMDDKQARDIINQVLKSGRDGQAADNAIEYVAGNFRKFNMSAVDSMKFYELAVDRAGASTLALTNVLENFHETAGETGVSVATLEQSFSAISGVMVDQGGGPESVSAAAAISQVMAFADESGTMSRMGITPDVFFGSDIFRNEFARNLGAANWMEVAPMLSGPNAASTPEQVAAFRGVIEGVMEPYMDWGEQELSRPGALMQMTYSVNAQLGTNFSQSGVRELLRFVQEGGFEAGEEALTEQAEELVPTRDESVVPLPSSPGGFWSGPGDLWEGAQNAFRGITGDYAGIDRSRFQQQYHEWQQRQTAIPGAVNTNPIMEDLIEGSMAFDNIAQWSDDNGLHTMRVADWIDLVGMEEAIRMINENEVQFANMPEDFENVEGALSRMGQWDNLNAEGFEEVRSRMAEGLTGAEWTSPMDTIAPGAGGYSRSGEGAGTYSMGQGVITVDITPRAAQALDISYTDSGEVSTGNATNTEQTRTGSRNRNHGWDAGGLW
jgi:hypothetical protein